MNKPAMRILLVGVMALISGCSSKPPTVGSDRGVFVEAESSHDGVNTGSHYWKVERKERPSHLLAFPSRNKVFERKDIVANAPAVAYRVVFEEPGTYYLWVRGRGEAGGASVVPGLDGVPLAEGADFMGFFPGEFSWIGGLYEAGKRTVLTIDTGGEHAVKFWMLEDGFRFDRFMITADPGLIPE